MIDFGDAPEQKESGGNGPIPPKSFVKVRLEVREPKKGDPSDPCVAVFSSGLKGVDCEFTVIGGGAYDGNRLWENWFLPPGMQTISLTKGQEGICNGSHAKMRAAIEASRGIDPADPAGNRKIDSWYDMNGLEFPVKVGVQKIKPGDKYLNNEIVMVLTPDHEHYEAVMAGAEIISDLPLPELPATTGGAVGSNSPPHPANDPNASPPPAKVNTPNWANRKK